MFNQLKVGGIARGWGVVDFLDGNESSGMTKKVLELQMKADQPQGHGLEDGLLL